MRYQCHFHPYRRPFRQPVMTSHGVWAMREGIILRLMNEAGSIGWGEIAPIPWFGSETIAQALAFCHQLPATLSDELIFAIPEALPCCQFAFESAWEGMRGAAIGRREPQRRRDAENQVSFSTENSTLPPQHSTVAAQNSDIAALDSELKTQNSKLSPQNSDVAASSSTVAVPNSTLQPQNSDLAPQNSDVVAQNSDIGALNSTLRSPNSKLKTQNSKLFPPHPSPLTPHPSLSYSALLPAGNAALHAWEPLWEQGFRTFKWKIGVQAIATELEILRQLTLALPNGAKLRLDANGGLSVNEATQWLQVCDALADDPNRSAIEYLEQPLPVVQFHAMQDLSQRHATPIALDESVATLQQLQTCYENGWRGVFVIKPAIVGSPSRLRQFCQTHPLDAVFSSAFETAIGRQAGLQLAVALGNPDRAVGYGTMHWFDAAANDFEYS